MAAHGHEVTVIDVRAPKDTRHRFRHADIRCLPEIVSAMRGAEVVYHLAAEANVNQAHADPLSCVALNLQGTANVLETARIDGVSRVVFASTVWVYNAARGDTVDEGACLDIGATGHLYTSTKIAGEMMCHNYWQQYQLPFTILRYGIPYGPGMRDDLVVPIFFRKALAGEPLTINGDGRQYRKFVYIDDLAEGNCAGLTSIARNQTYNLEGTEAVTIRQIAEAVGSLVKGVMIEFTPGRPGDFKGRDILAQKAAEELDWTPRVPFQEGLRRSYEWYLTAHPRFVPASAR